MKILIEGGPGYIEFVDSYGTDMTVVQSALVSTGAASSKDPEGLINYMLRHNHSTPFRTCFVTVVIYAPIFLFRQWMRHNIGITYNEISGRYVELPAEYYVPKDYHFQSTSNKQGASLAIPQEDADFYQTVVEGVSDNCQSTYKMLLDAGVAKEEARMILPLSQFSMVRMTASMEAVMHFLGLRLDSHAQGLMREYAAALHKIAECIWPATIEAWENQRLNSFLLNGNMVVALQDMLAGKTPTFAGMSKREIAEFQAKFPVKPKEELGFDKAPNRYMQGGIETIDLIRNMLEGMGGCVSGVDVFSAYCFGQFIKYVSRGDTEKPGSLKKAKFYAKMYFSLSDSCKDPRSYREGFSGYKEMGDDEHYENFDRLYSMMKKMSEED